MLACTGWQYDLTDWDDEIIPTMILVTYESLTVHVPGGSIT